MPISDAIILAAGQGTRLKPLTDSLPKALVPVGDEAILGRLLRQLDAAGVARIHVVTGYRAGDIVGFVGNHRARGITRLIHNDAYDSSNNAYSLALALQHIAGPFALLDGDLVLSDALVKTLCGGNDSALLCDTDRARLDDEAMKVTCDLARGIIAIGKKIPLASAHGESIGAARFDAAWMDALKAAFARMLPTKPCAQGYYEDVIATLINRGDLSPLNCLPVGTEKWVEVDDAADLARAEATFGEFPTAPPEMIPRTGS